MPSFRYEGWDSSGAEAAGRLEAKDANEAVRRLSAQGVRVRRVLAEASAPSPAPVPRIAPIPAPSHAPPRTPPTVSVPPSPAIRGSSNDRQRHFAFAMLADQLRAGISPAKAFESVAGRSGNQALAQAFREAGHAAARGSAPSGVLEANPSLFPPFAAGMVRAGEVGGFLPEACEAVSDQAEAAHSFRRMFWWGSLLVVQSVAAIPFVAALRTSLLGFWERAEAMGAQLNPAEIGEIFGSTLLWPVGPISIGLLALWILGARLLARPRSLMFRHRLALRWPVVGKRAQEESIATFSWVLARLSRAGLAPQRAWEGAAAAVPNAAMAERLREAYRLIGEGTAMAEAAARSGVFEDEYTATIANGELVGNLPDALERVARSAKRNFEASERTARVRIGCWFLLGAFALTAVSVGIFMFVWYREIPTRILGE